MKPYAIIALLAAWVASLFGVGAWQRHDGKVVERTAWEKRENEKLRKANDKIIELEEGNRKAEQAHAAALAGVSTDYERKLSDAKKQRADDAAAVRSGNLRLRDPGTTGLRACGSIGIEIGSGTGERNGTQGSELSAEATGFLLDLAADADDVARQLSACQAVVLKDRELR